MKNNQKENTKKSKKLKVQKFVNIFMPVLGCTTLAGGVAAIVVATTKTAAKSDPLTSAHEIKLSSVEGWDVTCNKQTAKKGDKVKFDVMKASNASVNKIPDYLSVGSNKFLLTKDQNVEDLWSTGEIVWEFVEDKTVVLTLKEEIVSDVLWDVGFYLNGGTTTDDSKLHQKIQDKCLVTNFPYIAAPSNSVFDKWQISTDFGDTWKDYDIEKDVITTSTIIKPIWKYSDEIIHTSTFFCNTAQGEQWISGKTTNVEIKNNTLWKDVEKPVIEKQSYELDGWYYIDSNGNVVKLADDTKLSFANSISFTIFAFWKEAKGTITFTTKDDKLSYATAPAASYKIETGTKLREIARPTILGSKDAEKIYYPNGTWLIKDSDDNWTPVNESMEFNSNTNITIAPDYSEATIGQKVTTYVIFDAGEGDFGSDLTKKVFTHEQTITAETTELGCKWSDVKSSEPVTINPPKGWQLTDPKWGITLTDNTLLFGNITLKANYIPTEKHTYTIQLTSDEQYVSWSGTQLYTKEYVGKPEDENIYTIGDLGFIKKEENEYGDITYSLDGVKVSPKKEVCILNGWEYYKKGTWVPFSDSGELSNFYSAMYTTKLKDIADSDGNIKIRPTFTEEGETINLFLVSGDTNIYCYEGSPIITITKKEASTKTFKEIMETKCTALWNTNPMASWELSFYIPIGYTDLITGKKINANSTFADTTAIKIHWGAAAFSQTVSLVNCHEYWHSGDSEIKVGTIIPQCMWKYEYEGMEHNTINNMCNKYYNGEYASKDALAQGFGYDKLDELIGLERTVEINGHNHKVRLIGIEHDTIADDEPYAGKKAVFTFEMVDLLSDVDGKAMLSYFDKTNGNIDYTNSELRKNLTGKGSATAKYYKKDGTDPVTSFTTAFEMLPFVDPEVVEQWEDLQGAIKPVKKHVATKTDGTSEYTLKEYEDKLFPLTATEMAITDQTALAEGTAYPYWTNTTIGKTEEEQRVARRKKPITHEEASIPGHCYSLTSPLTTNQYYTWVIDEYGQIYQNLCLDNLPIGNATRAGVSFAFCI